MMLDDILGTTQARVVSTAKSAASLVESSAVQATGKTAKATAGPAPKSPAIAAAVLAIGALGAIVGMRVLFKGAIS